VKFKIYFYFYFPNIRHLEKADASPCQSVMAYLYSLQIEDL